MKGKWFFIAVSAMAGIATAHFRLDWVVILLVAVIVVGVFLWKPGRLLGICIVTFFLAFCYFYYVDQTNVTAISETRTDFSGKMMTLPDIDGDRLTFRMKLDNPKEIVQVSYQIKTKQQKTALQSMVVGMSCSFHGKLEQPPQARNFYAFDYRKYLYRQQIHWQVTPDALARSSCASNNLSLLDQLRQWRQYGIEYIHEHYPDEIRGITAALIFGDRHGVSENILEAYRSLGIIHLLAVSGLHVGLVISGLFYLGVRLGLTKERSFELLFFILPVYVVLTGATPSVVRAGCMAMVVLICLRFKRRLHPIDGISLVFLLMLMSNPYDLFGVGFQLSFFISFVLIVSAPYVQKRYVSRWGQLLAVTMIAQLASLPMILYHFYQISLLSLPLNMIFIPFISFFVLPLSFLSFFLHLFHPMLSKVIVDVLVLMVKQAHDLLLFLHQQSFGLFVFGKLSVVMLILFFVVIFYGFLVWEQGGDKKRFISPITAFFIVCCLQWFAPYFSDEGTVTMLDVGQGDSILIELPHRRAVYLIDSGGTISFQQPEWQKQSDGFRVGKDVVLQELKARGIRKIDRFILTHGDLDHIRGAKDLLGGVEIEEMVYGKAIFSEPFARKLLRKAYEQGVELHPVQEGDSWREGRTVFSVLNPTGKEEESNAASIVIAARFGGLDWLFTGDLEKSGESRLTQDYPQFQVDVLKVGHHGSKTSTTEVFLNHFQPQVALISAGEHNLYGHPHQTVIDRLKKHGITVFRTDQMGSIQFKYDQDRKKFAEVIKP